MNVHNISIGKRGEFIARQFLIKHDYKIINAHWQKRVGEIDIIAHDPTTNEVVFVEVKTRSNTQFGWPEEKVTSHKKEKIYKTAQLFLIDRHIPKNQLWRIDVISIIIGSNNKIQITHFKNISLD